MTASRWHVPDPRRTTAALAAALLLGLGVRASLLPLRDRQAPPPLPAAACEPWMADAIPKVGAKTRDAVRAGIRAGKIPAPAREWFSP